MPVTPGFFRLDVFDSRALPLGAEFDCVYAPEATTRRGWQRVTFRVVAVNVRGQRCRMYQELAAQDISEAEAARLWAWVAETAKERA